MQSQGTFNWTVLLISIFLQCRIQRGDLEVGTPTLSLENFDFLLYIFSKNRLEPPFINGGPTFWKISAFATVLLWIYDIIIEYTLSKCFERCVYKQVHNYMLNQRVITPHQSSFTRRDSAVNQLIDISNSFGWALDSGKEIRVVFFATSQRPSTGFGIEIFYLNLRDMVYLVIYWVGSIIT